MGLVLDVCLYSGLWPAKTLEDCRREEPQRVWRLPRQSIRFVIVVVPVEGWRSSRLPTGGLSICHPVGGRKILCHGDAVVYCSQTKNNTGDNYGVE